MPTSRLAGSEGQGRIECGALAQWRLGEDHLPFTAQIVLATFPIIVGPEHHAARRSYRPTEDLRATERSVGLVHRQSHANNHQNVERQV